MNKTERLNKKRHKMLHKYLRKFWKRTGMTHYLKLTGKK